MAENGHMAVFITVPGRDEAARIAGALVSEKLAACVNQIEGISSVFWWEGEIQRETEVLLMAKTAARRVEALVRRVKELHSYTVPEVIALPIAHGNPDYLRWIDESSG